MENPGNQLKTDWFGDPGNKTLNATIIFSFVSCHEQKLIFRGLIEDKFALTAFLFMCVLCVCV